MSRAPPPNTNPPSASFLQSAAVAAAAAARQQQQQQQQFSHHHHPHSSSDLHHPPHHHLPPHPSLAGDAMFHHHCSPFVDAMFHPAQPPPPAPPPPPQSHPSSFHPPPVNRKPSLLSGYHNPAFSSSSSSSPERSTNSSTNERLINSAMQINQQQHSPRYMPGMPGESGASSRSHQPPPPLPPLDSTSAAALAALAASTTYMNLWSAAGRQPPPPSPLSTTNVSSQNASNVRPDVKFMRECGGGQKLRSMSPAEQMMRSGLKYPPPPPDADVLMRGDRLSSKSSMRSQSPLQSLPTPPQLTPAMMAAATAMANVMSSSSTGAGLNMPAPTSSPSQIAQFIQQLQQQQQQQQASKGMPGSQPHDLLFNIQGHLPPPPPSSKKDLPQSTAPHLLPPHLSAMFPPPPSPLPSHPSQPSASKQAQQQPPLPPPQQQPQQTPTTPKSSSSSSSYVPQVEAISPTPEDQKENSSVQLMKDKILSEIEKVEKDLASTQYQIELLKKRTIEIEEEQNKKPVDENDVEKLVHVSNTLTLAEKIYQENRKKAEESHRSILKPVRQNKISLPIFDDNIPFYQEFTDTRVSFELRAQFDTVMKRRLIRFFKRQIAIRKQRERSLMDNYDELHTKWQKKVDRTENSMKKRQKDGKSREFYEKVFPELRKQREERERFIQKQKAAAMAAAAAVQQQQQQNSSPTSASNSSEPQPFAASTEAAEPNPIEEERKRIYQLAVVPPMCIDARQRKYKFINNNGYIQDPVALFKSAKNDVYWNEKEKEIFLDKLVTFGKNFELIATFLDKKNVQDCIEYYYLTKKKVNYKMLIRKNQRRRKKDIKTNATTSTTSNASSASSNINISQQLINSAAQQLSSSSSSLNTTITSNNANGSSDKIKTS